MHVSQRRENIQPLNQSPLPRITPYRPIRREITSFSANSVQGNNRTLDNTDDKSEFYPKCKVKCANETNVLRPKRKAVLANDLKGKGKQ